MAPYASFPSRPVALTAILVVAVLAAVPLFALWGVGPAPPHAGPDASVSPPLPPAPFAASAAAAGQGPVADPTAGPTAPEEPPVFTRNLGQAGDADILYYARSAGLLTGFGDGFVRFVLDSGRAPAPRLPSDPDRSGAAAPGGPPSTVTPSTVTLSFEGARATPPVPFEPAAGTRHFFVGSDPAAWRQDVPSYGTLVYRELWPGTDVVYRATGEGPKYEVVLHPGADLSRVSFSYAGAQGLSLTPQGALVVATAAGPLQDSPPVASSGGAPVDCSFVLRSPSSAGIVCPGWDGARTLVVDPLVFSTYLGGSSSDYGRAVQVRSDGSICVGGYTYSSNFPATAGAYDPTSNSGYDQFVACFAANGSALLWATYLGGSSSDYAYDMSVDAVGDVYVAGYSISSDFPTTDGAFQNASKGTYDATLSKLDATGSALVFSTYLGGSSSDFGRGVSVGANNTVYVSGYTFSSNFPTTDGAFRNTSDSYYDAFVSRLNQTGALLASTYLGGTGYDYAEALRTDGNGLPVIAGRTSSTNFPTTSGAYQRSSGGSYDAFVTRLSADLSALSYSTYLGGSSTDYAFALALYGGAVAHVTGYTYSSNFPVAGNSYSSSFGGSVDAFVARLDLGSGRLVYSTFLGGTSYDYGQGIAVNGQGHTIVTGYTQSNDFPVSAWADQTRVVGSYDAFVVRLDAAGSSIVFASFIGGSSTDYGYSVATDGNRTAFITGYTGSSNFPTTPGAFDTSISSGDAFLTVVQMRRPQLTLETEPPGLLLVRGDENVSTPFVEECTGLRFVNVITPQVDGDTRYVFNRWSNDGPPYQGVDCSLGDVSLTAHFRTDYRANITTDPPGLPLVVDGASTPTPALLWWEKDSYHRLNAPATHTAGGVRYSFASWADGTGGQFNFSAVQPLALVARYDVTHYLVQAVTDRPNAYVLFDTNRYDGPLFEWMDAGSSHTLSAPDLVMNGTEVRYVFERWSDDGPRTRLFNATVPLDLVAHFFTQYLTTLTTDPPEISLDLDEQEVGTPYSDWWREGEAHRIKGPAQEVEVGDTRYLLAGWVDSYASERLVYADQPVTYTALFTPSSYRTTFLTVPPGLEVVVDRATHTTPVDVWWDADTDHVVQATSPQFGESARYVFTGWSDHLQVTHVISASGPLVLAARFATEYEVVVDTEPPGLAVTIDGVGGTAPMTVWWREGVLHEIGVEGMQSLGPSQRWEYDAWSDGGVRVHSAAADGPTTFTATFVPSYLLTLESAHGVSPCDQPDCWYRGGTSATFRVDSPQMASNGVRFAFDSWVGDYSSQEENATVVMDGPKKVTAVWKLQYELTVVSGYGEAEGAGWYEQGTKAAVRVAETEVTVGDVKYVFVGWIGGASSPSAQANVTMDGPRTVTASWEEVKPEAPPPVDDTGGETQEAAGRGADAVLVGGLAAAAALAAVIGLLVLRRRGAHETEGGEEALAAPAAATGDVKVALPAVTGTPAAPAAVRPVAGKPPAPGAAAPGTQTRPVRRASVPAPAAAPQAKPPAKLACHSCAMPVDADWSVCPSCGALLLR